VPHQKYLRSERRVWLCEVKYGEKQRQGPSNRAHRREPAAESRKKAKDKKESSEARQPSSQQKSLVGPKDGRNKIDERHHQQRTQCGHAHDAAGDGPWLGRSARAFTAATRTGLLS